jgi:hypothetical protein
MTASLVTALVSRRGQVGERTRRDIQGDGLEP